MELDYDSWARDGWRRLEITSGREPEVGRLVGELLWALHYEVYFGGPAAMDPVEAAEGGGGGTHNVPTAEPRGVVASDRLGAMRRIVEDALGLEPEIQADAWLLTRCPSVFDDSTGSWRPLTFEEAGQRLGKDRKTIARWVAAGDSKVTRGVEARGWVL